MGKSLSILRAKVFRPVRNFNVEERAMKSISEDKRAAAPPYRSMEKVMDEIKNDPNLLTKGKVDQKQLDNLSKIYVKSEGDNAVIHRRASTLPQERKSSVDYLYGYEEPPNIRPGKVSFRSALDILNRHATDKEVNSPEALAKEYNLDAENVANIVNYFKTLEVIMNAKKIEREKNVLKRLQQGMDNIRE